MTGTERGDLRHPPTESQTGGETVYVFHAAPTAGKVRLDVFITRSVENASRSKVQESIAAGRVTVNGVIVLKAGHHVAGGDVVVCRVPKPPPPLVEAENIPLDIRYEDESVLVVNKPAMMVVHPAHGNHSGTLVNALLWHTRRLSSAGGADRPGILHRLDKGTSGLLCVARTDEAHRFLAKQFAERTIEREYLAIVWGTPEPRTGVVEAPIGRHRSDRKRMAVTGEGKPAATEYTVVKDFGPLSLLRLKLRTGRTHQIRVHLSSMRHPLLGDPVYGGRRILYGSVTPAYKHFIAELLDVLPRQALHARTLGFVHPVTRQRVFVESELPADMQEALERIERYFSAP
ncbi:MAG: RluA family pseudouridine synthase [Bacteroidota bacterium]|nr:RluA family pseudouridine synthase [Bacteroidota bacterium]